MAAMLERVRAVVVEDDFKLIEVLARVAVEATDLLRKERASLARLRRLFGLARSEKTADIKVKAAESTAPTPGENAAPATSATPGENADATCSPASPATCSQAPTAGADGGPKKRKGHGRLPTSVYVGAEHVAVAHQSLCVGDRCPDCRRGHLYELSPVPVLRILGQPPLGATCWDCQRLRCGTCGKVFTARPPAEAQGEKVDESAAAMIATLHCGTGIPFHRLEQLQRNLGVPLPASTQWHAIQERTPLVEPVFDELARLAAQAEILYTDDSSMRILSLMGRRRAKLIEKGALTDLDRTGIYTTAVLAAIASVGMIALFFTGRKYSGENLDDLLDKRDPHLPAPLLMSDALDRNVPKRHTVVEANCVAHGRRKVVDEIVNFPAECLHLLERLALVYKVDNECAMGGLSKEERLRVHQQKSTPVMEELRAWMTAQIEDKRIEPNSDLGKAFNYFLKRWKKFTVFLRVPGAPIDNNISERALKMAIKLRNASLFYRSERGARVGDIYMTLIHTAELHRQNPVHYVTALFRHHKEVAVAPAEWLPWNYKNALARLHERAAAASHSTHAPPLKPPPPRSAPPTATGPRRPLPRDCRPRAATALRARAAAGPPRPAGHPAASIERGQPKIASDTTRIPGHRTQEA